MTSLICSLFLAASVVTVDTGAACQAPRASFKAKRLVFTGEGRDAHNTPYAPEALRECVDETCIENGLTLPPLSLTVLSFRPSPTAER